MGLFGLGKPRSRFGKFLDQRRITQEELAKESGVSRNTISRLCSDDFFKPNMRTASRIIRAIRDLTGDRVSTDDFWM